MTLKIKLAVAVILAGLLAGFWFHGINLAAERDRLADQCEQLSGHLAASQISIKNLTAELDWGRRALADREAEKSRLAEEMDRLSAELEMLYEQDCEAGAWADNPLPNGVVQRLRTQ